MSSRPISILVTGANQGIGFSIVQQLLKTANNVHIYAAARSMTKAQETVRKLIADPSAHTNNKVKPVVIDLSDDNTISTAAKQIPSLDILVNNAGIYVKEDYTTPQLARKALHDAYDTNLFGTIALTSAFLPILTNQEGQIRPAIINVTTGLASFTNMTDQSSPQYKTNEIFYSSSKTALNAFTISMSKQYPQVRIVAVAPGHTATALNGFKAPQTVEVGAKYIVDAIMDFDGPTGVFLQKGKQHGW